jgi:hypothetical protein
LRLIPPAAALLVAVLAVALRGQWRGVKRRV